jgi:hypothetical protein
VVLQHCLKSRYCGGIIRYKYGIFASETGLLSYFWGLTRMFLREGVGVDG